MTEKINKKSISTESYKGVRDFYPEDMAIQNYIFSVWKKTAESFGYSEYNASVLEPTDLYKSKSGEEIVNEQTYSFKDRGGREVTLRPEMTPTVARMIAAKRKSLVFPIRWYSIPNLFRYEKPQRGRTREHWQLNVDLFGLTGLQADVEMISISYYLMKNFKINDSNFKIFINNRGNIKAIVAKELDNDEEKINKYLSLIDRKRKISEKELNEEMIKYFGKIISYKTLEPDDYSKQIIQELAKHGIKNVEYNQDIVRGFSYYTGVVFEVYDNNKENPRALFGGGRYDNLLDIFDVEKIPAVGFGMGDVTIRDVLETYNFLPEVKSVSQLYICVMNAEYIDYAQDLAEKFREKGVNTMVDYSDKKVGEQIKYADKNKIPFVVVIGEEEVKTGKLKIKELSTGKETETTEDKISEVINK